MKREFLQSFQVEGQPLPKEVIDAIMAENGRDIQKVKAQTPDQEQLAAAAAQWESKYTQAVEDHRQALDRVRFDHTLELAILEARGRNAKAIGALLDVESLKASEDPKTAIAQALEQLKQESAYLFAPAQTPPLYAGGTGTPGSIPTNQPATLAGALREKFERK